jgi:acyl dehydratase
MADDELQPGQVFTSPSKTLTDAHFLFFSGLTGDNHPIHYDVEYARTTRFGKPLAHGLLLASLTALGASPASPHIDGFVFVEQGCRFLKPVAVGDTIHPRLTVERVWQEGRRRFVRLADVDHESARRDGARGISSLPDHSAPGRCSARRGARQRWPAARVR